MLRASCHMAGNTASQPVSRICIMKSGLHGRLVSRRPLPDDTRCARRPGPSLVRPVTSKERLPSLAAERLGPSVCGSHFEKSESLRRSTSLLLLRGDRSGRPLKVRSSDFSLFNLPLRFRDAHTQGLSPVILKIDTNGRPFYQGLDVRERVPQSMGPPTLHSSEFAPKAPSHEYAAGCFSLPTPNKPNKPT